MDLFTDQIDASSLSGGGLRFRLQKAAEKSLTQKSESATTIKENARVITVVWGEHYVDHLLRFAIPALLAPGNLPVLVEHFNTELVIVTETRLFHRISRAPVTARVLQHCDMRLHPIDDLIATHYGITLTYALVRGFADLGDAMAETHLVFFNSDFIVADGSYRKLINLIKRGERLVAAPSYCMVYEDATKALRRYYEDIKCSMTVSPRDLAAIIIAHRHNTVRAKTLNQRLLRHHRYDQFYWYVDEHTMLARMLPIAIVYMRPEKTLTELDTFWDYGAISDYCPTTKPCVISDSDEFLMGEFREALALKDLFSLGFPTEDEIVEDLSSFTTQYHRDHSEYTLVLHSQELPNYFELEKRKFDEAADAILSRLGPPVNAKNHKFWAESFPRF